MIDEQTFRVLNAVHLKRLAQVPQVSVLVTESEEVVLQVLAAAVQRGAAVDMGGQYMLADEGVQEVRQYYQTAYAEQRSDGKTTAWYERFKVLNTDFIKQVSEYQGGAGDRAQTRLMKTVERLVKALGELTPMIPRYESYIKRFDEGLSRIDEGQLQYVASPTIDSVHNIWFEFHEDILTVLGRPRDT